MGALSSQKPVILDESDDSLDAFVQGKERGYLGVSSKTCKGLYKSILNRARCAKWNAEAGTERYIMSAEDLTIQAGLALQQDLALVSLLGITHIERNGHHYVNGMAALSIDPIGQGERSQILNDQGEPQFSGTTTEHFLVGVGSILVGRNTAGYRAWDAIRARFGAGGVSTEDDFGAGDGRALPEVARALAGGEESVVRVNARGETVRERRETNREAGRWLHGRSEQRSSGWAGS